MISNSQTVIVDRWSSSQHPSMQNVTKHMKAEGLRPYMWEGLPNYRHAIRSHGYTKILYILDGAVEVILPDTNQRLRLKVGDRVEIPSGVRHGINVGSSGTKCCEAARSSKRY